MKNIRRIMRNDKMKDELNTLNLYNRVLSRKTKNSTQSLR